MCNIVNYTSYKETNKKISDLMVYIVTTYDWLLIKNFRLLNKLINPNPTQPNHKYFVYLTNICCVVVVKKKKKKFSLLDCTKVFPPTFLIFVIMFTFSVFGLAHNCTLLVFVLNSLLTTSIIDINVNPQQHAKVHATSSLIIFHSLHLCIYCTNIELSFLCFSSL